MTYRGHVKNGKVILEEPLGLPEGTRVVVQVAKKGGKTAKRKKPARTLAERLAPVIGKAKGLPPDLSVNLDHYLYGLPKRK